MKKFITIFPLLVLLAMAACTGNSTFERQLAVADSLMRHNYDSAYTLLKDMDSMAQHMPERLRMKHMLLRANAQNKAWEFFTSDSTGKTLTQYYDRKGTPNERMLAHYIKGCAYRDMGDEPMALQCFNEAVAAADTADTQCDFYQLSIIYGQIARFFKRRALANEALEAYGMAEHYAWKAQDSLRVLNIWSNKAECLIDKRLFYEGLELYEKTAKKYREIGRKREAARAKGGQIKWYSRLKEHDKAKAAMEEYEAHSGYFQPNGDIKPGWEFYYHMKGTYYLEVGVLDSAMYFFRKLKQENATANNIYLAAWGQAQVYQKLGNSDSLAKYALESLFLNDSIYGLKATENLQNLQAMYNYANHKKVAQRKELEAKEAQLSRRNWIIGALSATFLLTLLALWLRGQVRHKQQKLQEASKENEILHAKVKEKAITIEELNSYVAERTEIINSLNEQLNKNSINIEEYHKQAETIQILNKKIENFERDILHRIDAQKINQLSDNKAIITIRELLDTRRCCPTENEWLALYDIAEKYFPILCNIKANPKISSIEYQICVLTKLLFEVNEIVFLTGKSNSFITAKRKRMLPKLFNCTGSAKDFDNRIIGL